MGVAEVVTEPLECAESDAEWPGKARRVFEMAQQAGLELTPVGATFPYGKDPEDRNIRIAPTLPPDDELERAITVLATAILCAADD